MYQIEVKRFLVSYLFPVREGWQVTVNLDAMELGKGKQNPPEKSNIADRCHQWLEAEGVVIGAHSRYSRADLVAHKDDLGTYVIEVEGDSSK